MSAVTLFDYNLLYQTRFFHLWGKFSAADLEVYPASRILFFPSSSRIKKAPDPEYETETNDLSIFNPKDC